jgi:hypothetical protein
MGLIERTSSSRNYRIQKLASRGRLNRGLVKTMGVSDIYELSSENEYSKSNSKGRRSGSSQRILSSASPETIENGGASSSKIPPMPPKTNSSSQKKSSSDSIEKMSPNQLLDLKKRIESQLSKIRESLPAINTANVHEQAVNAERLTH